MGAMGKWEIGDKSTLSNGTEIGIGLKRSQIGLSVLIWNGYGNQLVEWQILRLTLSLESSSRDMRGRRRYVPTGFHSARTVGRGVG